MSDSVWNRIGDVFSSIGKVKGKVEEIQSGITGVAKLGSFTEMAKNVAATAWDLGTAPWNDDKEYNGFSNTLKTIGKGQGAGLVKPLANAAGAINKVPGVSYAFEKIDDINEAVIREPAATFNLALGDVARGEASFFDPDTWKKAYAGAESGITFGQAKFYADDVLNRKVLNRSYFDPEFNIYDPREREEAFKKGTFASFASGTYDVEMAIFGDVTLVAGKAAKVVKASELAQGVVKNADKVAKFSEDITKAQYGVKNRFTPILKDFTKNDSLYALNHPMVQASDQPALLASLLGASKDIDNTALILRSAMGDPMAMRDLSIMRADMSDALKAARADLSTVDEFKLFAQPDEAGMLPFLNESDMVINDAAENYAALAKNDEYFAKLMELGEGGGALTRTSGPLVRGAENFIAQARAAKYYDKTPGVAKVEVFQPTPFHRMYQKISWAAGERPAGIINFNDADSYKEIVATIDMLDGTSRLGRKSKKAIVALTPGQKAAILDEYITAATPEARFAAVQKLETSMVRTVAAKYGISEDAANALYNDYSRARSSALKNIKDKGFMVDLDGEIIKVPMLESQSADYLPIMDFTVLDNVLRVNKGDLMGNLIEAKQGILNVADVAQDLFKAGALLRLGYTQRNAIDSQLRIAAAVGAMTTLRHLGPGMKHLINNSVKTPARLIDRFKSVDSGMKLPEINKASLDVAAELKVLKEDIAALEAKLSLRPDDVALEGKLATLKIVQEDKQAIYKHYSEVLARNADKPAKERIGTGTFSITTTDGRTYELPDAFGGPLGDMYRRLASSGNTIQRLFENNSDLYRNRLASKGIQKITPEDPGYFDQWAQTLRQQFGNSAVIKKLAAGESVDDVTYWLTHSPEGRDLRKRLYSGGDDLTKASAGLSSRESEEYVTRINDFFNQYLPASSGLRGKINEITAADLRRAFTDPTELPVIHGHLLEEAMTLKSRLGIKNLINEAFHFLGTLPEDTWARNPLYVHLYRKEAERRVQIMAAQKGDLFSVADQEKIMGIAHRTAQRQMKEILFNIERRSNLAATLKFISPFFSAQENAYKTWFKLAVANPAIANRAYMVWQAPNQAGWVVDQDGNPVPAGQTSGNDIMLLPIPKGATKIPFIGKGLEPFVRPDAKEGDTTIYSGGLGIPKASLDLIFQGGLDVLFNKGNPNIASDIFPVGPYVGVPVSEIVKLKPSYEDSLKWALPFGAYKDVKSAFLPSWFQKLQTRVDGVDDVGFAKSYQLIYYTEQHNAMLNGTPMPSDKEILNKTKDYWNMRTVASLVMPFAPRFESPYKFYMDKSREYDRKFGVNSGARFLNDFPEFFEFSGSLSKNPGSVQYSINATENIDRYGDLVATLYKIEPKLIGLVTNDPKGYEFSDAAYDYLSRKKISPSSKATFLSTLDPGEAQKKTQAEKGWIDYNKYMTAIDEELRSRGLSSTQEKGAEDLEFLKSVVVNKLSVKTDAEGKPIFNKTTNEYEPSEWYLDYKDSDGSKTNKVISGLNKVINDKKFWSENKDKPMWKSVSVYLSYRKEFAAELSGRKAKTLDAKSNADLKFLYDKVVSKLKEDDPIGFANLYDRFLSQDLLFDKNLTLKETK